jgi:hypothetical protein
LWPYLIFFEAKNGSKNPLELYFLGLVNIISIIKQGKIALKIGPQAPNKHFFSGAPSPHLRKNEDLTFFISGINGGGFMV